MVKIAFNSKEVELESKRWPKLLIGSAWIPKAGEEYIKIVIGWLKKSDNRQVFEQIILKPNDKILLSWNKYKLTSKDPDLKVFLKL